MRCQRERRLRGVIGAQGECIHPQVEIGDGFEVDREGPDRILGRDHVPVVVLAGGGLRGGAVDRLVDVDQRGLRRAIVRLRVGRECKRVGPVQRQAVVAGAGRVRVERDQIVAGLEQGVVDQRRAELGQATEPRQLRLAPGHAHVERAVGRRFQPQNHVLRGQKRESVDVLVDHVEELTTALVADHHPVGAVDRTVRLLLAVRWRWADRHEADRVVVAVAGDHKPVIAGPEQEVGDRGRVGGGVHVGVGDHLAGGIERLDASEPTPLGDYLPKERLAGDRGAVVVVIARD